VTNSYVNIFIFCYLIYFSFIHLLFSVLLASVYYSHVLVQPLAAVLNKPLLEFSSCRSDSTNICRENRIHHACTCFLVLVFLL